MRQIGHRELSGELAEAKKSVVKKTTPEVINHIRYMCIGTCTYTEHVDFVTDTTVYTMGTGIHEHWTHNLINMYMY